MGTIFSIEPLRSDDSRELETLCFELTGSVLPKPTTICLEMTIFPL
jgi:hypothetical protein